MSKFVLPAALQSEFIRFQEATELVDDQGRVIGRFVPNSALERLSQPASEAEVRRRLAAGEKRYSTDEVIRHLESL